MTFTKLWDEAGQQRLGLRLDQANKVGVYEWDDWYDYPGSYWVNDRKKRGRPRRTQQTYLCISLPAGPSRHLQFDAILVGRCLWSSYQLSSKRKEASRPAMATGGFDCRHQPRLYRFLSRSTTRRSQLRWCLQWAALGILDDAVVVLVSLRWLEVGKAFCMAKAS